MSDFTPHTIAYIDQSFAWVADPSPATALPQEPWDAAAEEIMDAVLSGLAHAIDAVAGMPRAEGRDIQRGAAGPCSRIPQEGDARGAAVLPVPERGHRPSSSVARLHLAPGWRGFRPKEKT